MLLEKVNRPAGIQCPPIKIMLRNTEGGNEKSLDEIMSSIVKDCGMKKALGELLTDLSWQNNELASLKKN